MVYVLCLLLLLLRRGRVCVEKVKMMLLQMPKLKRIDTLPEWSKGVNSSSTSASCVGSNPTGVNCLKHCKQASEKKIERDGDSKTARDADRGRERQRERLRKSERESE